MRLWIHMFFVLCICSCTNLDEELIVTSVEDNTYELLMDFDQEHIHYVKTHLIDYFKMIALGSEYGDQFKVSKKWAEPMKIFVDGAPQQDHVDELVDIIKEINEYASDGFYIEVVDESELANYHIFFGEGNAYIDQYSAPPELVNSNAGLFTIYTDRNFRITHGHMFVDLSIVSMEKQLHVLREELTQSLGLANDIDYYLNSIFYIKPSRIRSYSDLDIEVIRLLYHPQFIAGLHESNVQIALEQILGIN